MEQINPGLKTSDIKKTLLRNGLRLKKKIKRCISAQGVVKSSDFLASPLLGFIALEASHESSGGAFLNRPAINFAILWAIISEESNPILVHHEFMNKKTSSLYYYSGINVNFKISVF